MKKMKMCKSLAWLLAVCMTIILLPSVSLGAPPSFAMALGASGLTGQGESTVYYGVDSEYSPIEWLVLDTISNDGATPALFMLSKYVLDTVAFDSTSPMSNVWNDSNAQTWCADFCSGNFYEREENAVLLTTKTEAASGSWGNCGLSNDKVFFLSALEATDEDYGFLSDGAATDENRVGIFVGDTDAYHWWLRSPNAANSFSGGIVYPAGNIGIDDVGNNARARPAFNLDINSVIFTSAAVNGKLNTTYDGGFLPAIPSGTSDNWKLTIYDAGQTLTIDTVTRGEDEVTINYSAAATGTNQYVSAIITNSAGTELLRYGKLKAVPDASDASGTASLILPNGFDDNGWVLKIFSEQCNADYCTDYAGTLHKVIVPTAPTIADISAPPP